MTDMRPILRIITKIVEITLTAAAAAAAAAATAAHHRQPVAATATPSLFCSFLAPPPGAVAALHRAQGVGALLAGVRARISDLGARDDGFAAHGAEAGEERREEGAQAGDCRGHDGVEDFGLAADGCGDTVEGLVGGGELAGEVVDLEGGESDYSYMLLA